MAERSRSDTVQLKARMKEPLRAELEAAAEANGVSLNAEMVHRLEQSFIEDMGSESTRKLMRALALAKECDLVGMGIQTNLQFILEFNGMHQRPQIVIAIGESIQYFEDQVDLCRGLKGDHCVAICHLFLRT